VGINMCDFTVHNISGCPGFLVYINKRHFNNPHNNGLLEIVENMIESDDNMFVDYFVYGDERTIKASMQKEYYIIIYINDFNMCMIIPNIETLTDIYIADNRILVPYIL
jgi:hypothetical protein